MVAGAKVPQQQAKVGKLDQAQALKQQARDSKQGEVLGRLGLSDSGQLGAGARAALEGKLEAFDGKLDQLDVGQVAGAVHHAIAKDFAASHDAGPPPSDSAVIKGGSVRLLKQGKEGGMELVGAPRGKDHPVSQVLDQLGLDPTNLGPNAVKALRKARGNDVAHPATWKQLTTDLAEAKVLDAPITEVGKVAGRPAAGGASAAADIAAGADLGLAKTARTQAELDAAGPANNAESVMFNEGLRDPGAVGKRGQALQQLNGALAHSGLDQAQIEALQPTLDKMLKTGQQSAHTPEEKAWAIVKSVHREVTGKRMPDQKVPGSDAGLEGAMSMAAAYQLQGLVQAKTGAQLDGAFVGNAANVLESFTGAAAATGGGSSAASRLGKVNFGRTKRPAGAGQAQSSRKAGRANKKQKGAGIPKEVKAAAAEHAQKIGLDPGNPATAHTVADIEAAFNDVLKAGGSDKDIANRTLKYLNEKTGGADAQFAQYAARVMGVNGDNPEAQAMVKDFALGKLARMATMGPEAYAQQAAMGAAGAVPGGPGMQMPGGMQAAGGAGASTDNMEANMRFMMGASIMNDPALGVEDKVMLLLMLIMGDQDRDRTKKMQEIADLDRTEANGQPNAMQGGTTQSSGEASELSDDPSPKVQVGADGGPKSKSVSDGEAKATSQAAAPPPGAPPGGAAVPPGGAPPGGGPTGTQQGGPPGMPPGGVSGGEGADGQTMDMNHARAEGSAPKSREVLMAELNRINQVREGIFAALKKIIESYDENTKGVIRSMAQG